MVATSHRQQPRRRRRHHPLQPGVSNLQNLPNGFLIGPRYRAERSALIISGIASAIYAVNSLGPCKCWGAGHLI